MLKTDNLMALSGSRRPLNLTVEDGHCVALRGPSGAGKSMILRAIADLDPHTGTISLDGQPSTTFSGPQWRRRVVYVPTESGWWAETVGEHMPTTAPTYLTSLGLPDDALDWPVARLSTGEKQRLALIRALCLEPDALLLDEPTATLDAAAAAAVETIIREQRRRGAAIVLVSHDQEQAGRLADTSVDIVAGTEQT
jgi:putative ABC transport system ATP-binding protein